MSVSGYESSNRIPTEFQYWSNIQKPVYQRACKILRLLFRTDPTLPREVIEQFAYSYYDADPIAEAFVQEVYLQQGQEAGRAMLSQALKEGVSSVQDAPDSLHRLFAQIEETPEWLEPEKLALGAKVFRRWGTDLFHFAGAITLQGYQENSVAKPLAFTGTYTGESAARRFLETAQFWLDVSKPGGLLPGGEGVKTALRVRIMHVFVRKRLLEHPKWDLDAWGVPISQGDALLTLMGGSFLPGYLLKLMGYRTTREEIEATLHFWRYVGYLVGVQPRWYPQNVEEALGLMFTATVKGVRCSGEDGKNLAHSYLASYASSEAESLFGAWRKKLEYRQQLGFVSFFLPQKTYQEYGLPNPGLWRLYPLLQFPLVFTGESLRRRFPLVDELLDKRAWRLANRWVKSRLGERQAEYKAVATFTR